MSGRVRVTLADGRRVTGFRKTLAQRPRRDPAARGELALSFFLPTAQTLLTPPPGPVAGHIGVTVHDLGRIEVRGADHGWVLGQAAAFLDHVTRGAGDVSIAATLERGDRKSVLRFTVLRGPRVVLTAGEAPTCFPAGR